VGVGGPDPRRPDAPEILERSIVEYGFRGLKLIPKAGYYPWDEQVYPLYEKCLDHGVPVFVCTEPDGGGYNRDRFNEPIHLSDVLGDMPDLTVVMLHAGEPLYHWFEEALLVASRAANAFIEMSFWIRPHFVPNMIPSYLDAEESVMRMLARAISVLGSHRIAWGTDGHVGPKSRPNALAGASGNDWKGPVDWIRSLTTQGRMYGLEFSATDVDRILGETAARLVGIGPGWQRPDTYGWRRRMPSPFRGL